MRDPTTVIIDGYNLIKRVPTLSSRLGGEGGLNAARSYLLGSLRAYQARRGRRVVLVLDGPRDSRSDFGPVEVVYAVKADDAVVSHAGPDCLVVSSDNEVRRAAIGRGAAVLLSEDFWQALVASTAPRRTPSRSPGGNPRGGTGGNQDDQEGSAGRKPGKGNPRRKSKSQKRREQAHADLMRRV